MLKWVFSRQDGFDSGAFAAQQLTAVNCALHHSQSCHAKSASAKIGVFVLPIGQWTKQSEADSKSKET
jgi:hypothetical protein